MHTPLYTPRQRPSLQLLGGQGDFMSQTSGLINAINHRPGHTGHGDSWEGGSQSAQLPKRMEGQEMRFSVASPSPIALNPSSPSPC